MERSDNLEFLPLESWRGRFAPEEQNRALEAIEAGKVIVLPTLGFVLEPAETKFLAPSISGDRRKNISFDRQSRKIGNVAMEPGDAAALTATMDRFGRCARELVEGLLPSYAGQMTSGLTSYRPSEIEGRAYSPRKDDTRLHVDAFPSRPVRGSRILRVFTNIADDGAVRRWRLGEPFPAFAQKFAPRVKPPWPGAFRALELLGVTKSRRTAYDHYMLALHDLAKLDKAYQTQSPRMDVSFDPGTTWLCFTDQVLHAAVSGHAALEQTFYVPIGTMRAPSTAPLRVLEALTGRRLA
ncbi:MAG TPA: Kdo hydroxylase family protein [Roseiarcus sp.]|nr:Kdo hydroxylase family protein [Roseiarcus sp.]